MLAIKRVKKKVFVLLVRQQFIKTPVDRAQCSQSHCSHIPPLAVYK